MQLLLNVFFCFIKLLSHTAFALRGLLLMLFSGSLMEWLSCYPTAWTSEREFFVVVVLLVCLFAYNDISYHKVAIFPRLVLVLQSVIQSKS